MNDVDQEVAKAIKQHAGVGMFAGFVGIVAGALALLAPLVAGLSVALVVGASLIVSGVGRLLFAFRVGSLGVGLLLFFGGLLSALLGGYMLAQPGLALAMLTVVLAVYFVVSGGGECAWALRLRPTAGWGWTLCSGIGSLILGVLIWRQFPMSGVWAVGTLVGVQMIFGGTALVSICGAARRLGKAAVRPEL